MSSLATTVVTNQLKKAVKGNESSLDKINWNDFNYPPIIKIFHYDINHVKEEERPLMRKLNFVFMGQVLFFILNFINAIIQTAAGYSWLRIIASIFWYALVIGLTGYGFYNVFRAFCGDRSNAILKFKLFWGILVILFMF